jgi:hypothetical protein
MAVEQTDLDTAERRRRFRAALRENGHTVSSIARAAGLKTPNRLYNFVNSVSSGLKLETWSELAPHLSKSDLNYVIGVQLSDGRALFDVPASQKVSDRQRNRAFHQSAKAIDEIRRAVAAIHGTLNMCSGHIAMLEARLSDLAE